MASLLFGCNSLRRIDIIEVFLDRSWTHPPVRRTWTVTRRSPSARHRAGGHRRCRLARHRGSRGACLRSPDRRGTCRRHLTWHDRSHRVVATGLAGSGSEIHGHKEDVASSIAFTAILGVVVVIGLPFLITPLGLSHYQYGVLAGLTVYAVPQVLAAAFPVSVLSGQVGTLVKLVRVLMLGPVVVFFALTHRNDADAQGAKAPGLRLTRLVPWFIVGFLLLAALRSAGAIPTTAADAMKNASTWLTVASMAALGLGVDLKAIRRVGSSVIITVTASLAVLIALSVALIRVLSLR